MSLLQAVKFWLVTHLSLAKDALHVYVGLTLFFGAALLMGWGLKSWKPWAVVLVAAVTGEIWDLRDSVTYHGPIDLLENWKDLWNTMFWPSILLILARTTSLFEAGKAPPES